MPVPLGMGAPSIIGDAWSGTHGGTGREYASFFNSVCVSVAATTSALLKMNTWDIAAECVHPSVAPARADGPALQPDLGAHAIYITYAEVGTILRPAVLLRYAPCLGMGVPRFDDSLNCPFEWGRRDGNMDRHSNVVVNPCTHHPILLYRRDPIDFGLIDGTIFDTKSNIVTRLVIDESAPIVPNSNCGGVSCDAFGDVCRCNGNTNDCREPGARSPCLDLAPRVHAATRYEPETGQCLMYVAYDYSRTVDGDSFIKSRMKVFDITDEANVAELRLIESTDPGAKEQAFNDFNATVLVDFFSPRVGFFFYRQEGGEPCTTSYRGTISSDDAISRQEIILSASSFPSVAFNFADGLGHYVEGSDFTRPHRLFPVWSQPLIVQEPCVSCMGQNFSLVSMGSEVTP